MASDSESPKPFIDTPSPFDDPSTDIIIRSCEGVDFHIHKVLLALASPFFKGMFEIPQPTGTNDDEIQRVKSDGTRDGIPVITLYDGENAVCGKEVVEYVISSCHPACLQSPHPSLSSNMFGAVIDKGWAAEATLAAQGTLRSPIAHFPHDPALKKISGFQYHSLLEFHKRCGKAARDTDTAQRGKEWMSPDVLRWFSKEHDKCNYDELWGKELFPEQWHKIPQF
ncbi:hypothetical protein DFH07DRAFT_1017868 [Mycena maculata]|uniref:BTB domain-containing protein n=1 Tax=Mycena maculata TaxID=230809 RepID=A0AAD7NZZ7_9AGAR|nr:hypothetical protein DFH07DRAFT_1017868 [Mycena maculata]